MRLYNAVGLMNDCMCPIRSDDHCEQMLNPSDEEVQGFANLPSSRLFSDVACGLHDAVRGCLVNDTNHEKFCGAVALDTGDPGIRVVRAELSHQPWPNETPATLFFASPNGKIQVAERLIIGRKAHASHLTFKEKRGVPMPLLFTGLTPYLAYSILYDPEHGTLDESNHLVAQVNLDSYKSRSVSKLLTGECYRLFVFIKFFHGEFRFRRRPIAQHEGVLRR